MQMKEKGGFPNQEGKGSLSNFKCFNVSVLLAFHLCLIISERVSTMWLLW